MDDEQREPWARALERYRVAHGIKQEVFARQFGVSRSTYNEWVNGKRRPPEAQLRRISQLTGIPEAALRSALGLVQQVDPDEYLDDLSARQDAIDLYQGTLRSLVRAAGLTARYGASKAAGVDVLARVLREGLLSRGVVAAVTVLPVRRGRRRREPFHYQVVVTPERLLVEPTARASPVDLAELRSSVDDVTAELLLPMTRESSRELCPQLFADGSDVLLYPALLEPRPAHGTLTSDGWGERSILVCGVFQAGSPDVGALLADALGLGYARVEHLARASVHAGLRSVDNAVLHQALPRALSAVLRRRELPAAAAVWAVDDVGPLLRRGHLEQHLEHFTGHLVVVQLDEGGLDYAGELIQQHQGPPHDADAHTHWRTLLEEWQEALVDTAERWAQRRGPHSVVLEYTGAPRVEQRPDGTMPDAVHLMFDSYHATFERVLATLTRPRRQR